MKIYIAGTYSAPTWKEKQINTDKAIWAGIQVMLKGHNPFIPHLTHYIDKMAYDKNIFISYDKWMEIDNEWLELCDAFLYLNSSKGANVELEKAKKLDKIIFYDLNEIPILISENI